MLSDVLAEPLVGGLQLQHPRPRQHRRRARARHAGHGVLPQHPGAHEARRLPVGALAPRGPAPARRGGALLAAGVRVRARALAVAHALPAARPGRGARHHLPALHRDLDHRTRAHRGGLGRQARHRRAEEAALVHAAADRGDAESGVLQGRRRPLPGLQPRLRGLHRRTARGAHRQDRAGRRRGGRGGPLDARRPGIARRTRARRATRPP